MLQSDEYHSLVARAMALPDWEPRGLANFLWGMAGEPRARKAGGSRAEQRRAGQGRDGAGTEQGRNRAGRGRSWVCNAGQFRPARRCGSCAPLPGVWSRAAPDLPPSLNSAACAACTCSSGRRQPPARGGASSEGSAAVRPPRAPPPGDVQPGEGRGGHNGGARLPRRPCRARCAPGRPAGAATTCRRSRRRRPPCNRAGGACHHAGPANRSQRSPLPHRCGQWPRWGCASLRSWTWYWMRSVACPAATQLATICSSARASACTIAYAAAAPLSHSLLSGLSLRQAWARA